MSYEQHMRHFRSHRKDRFYQQCGGPAGKAEKTPTQEQMDSWERSSLLRLIEKTGDDEYPIYIRQFSDGVWLSVTENDCFGERIDSRDHLLQLLRDVGGHNE